MVFSRLEELLKTRDIPPVLSGLHRIGKSIYGDTATFDGNLSVSITGGSFAKNVTLSHGTDSPIVNGNAILYVNKDMQKR